MYYIYAFKSYVLTFVLHIKQRGTVPTFQPLLASYRRDMDTIEKQTVLPKGTIYLQGYEKWI